MKAADICKRAADLVAGDRHRQHGEKRQSFTATARVWNAFLADRLATPLTAAEVALLMVLFKVSQTQASEPNLDDAIDIAGYAGCFGELMAAEGGAEAAETGQMSGLPQGAPDARAPPTAPPVAPGDAAEWYDEAWCQGHATFHGGRHITAR